MSWEPPRIWDGDTVAILASGPSMSQSVADTVRGRCAVIAINDTYKLAPWADMLYACDRDWWKVNPHAMAFSGLKVSMQPVDGVLQVQNGGRIGFDSRPTHIKNGSNSGYQALHLAAHMGASRVLLCGYDMRMVGGKTHWFGEHEGILRKASPYIDWRGNFAVLAPELAARGVQVVNCTPGSGLECFQLADLDASLHRSLSEYSATA